MNKSAGNWVYHFVQSISFNIWRSECKNIRSSHGNSYQKPWKPNGLSKHLKSNQVFGLALSASEKLAVIWIIKTRVLPCSTHNLGFDLTYFSFFIVNLVHLELFFFTMHVLIFFTENQYINQTYTITSMEFPVFEMGLITLLVILVSILRANI